MVIVNETANTRRYTSWAVLYISGYALMCRQTPKHRERIIRQFRGDIGFAAPILGMRGCEFSGAIEARSPAR